jgi:hypothetical protein
MSESQLSDPDAQRRLLHRLYNSLRTARLNERYYYTLQWRMQRQETFLDIILAVTASALAILNLIYISRLISTGLAAEVAALALAKPILRFSYRQVHTALLATKFGQIRNKLQSVTERVGIIHTITPADWKVVEEALDEMNSISPLESAVPNLRLLREMQTQVNAEIPTESLWWPEPTTGQAAETAG